MAFGCSSPVELLFQHPHHLFFVGLGDDLHTVRGTLTDILERDRITGFYPCKHLLQHVDARPFATIEPHAVRFDEPIAGLETGSLGTAARSYPDQPNAIALLTVAKQNAEHWPLLGLGRVAPLVQFRELARGIVELAARFVERGLEFRAACRLGSLGRLVLAGQRAGRHQQQHSARQRHGPSSSHAVLL
jgi:hypothetical protein